MSRDRIYVFQNAWCWACEFSLSTHGKFGKYQEVVLGFGWNDREVSEMVCSLLEENSLELFCETNQ